jgi:hypothetical protein
LFVYCRFCLYLFFVRLLHERNGSKDAPAEDYQTNCCREWLGYPEPPRRDPRIAYSKPRTILATGTNRTSRKP